MVATEIVRSMIDYNYALHRRVWDSIMTLTDEQFVTEIPYSHGSIRNHMVHIASVDTRWLRGLQEKTDARTFNYNPEEYPTRESAFALSKQVADEVTAYINSLDDASLDRQPPNFPFKVWNTLLHLVNHGTDHRAQVLRALHDFGAPTFDQDVAFYWMQA